MGRLSLPMSNNPATVLILALAAVLVAVSAFAHEGEDAAEFDRAQALEISQAALGRLAGDYAFRDGDGRTVRISDYRGKPLVVSFIYTSCAHACPIITRNLADAVETARDALGGDAFRIVTVGFDAAADTPERMRAFARQHGARTPGWSFLSGDGRQVAGVAADLGFSFRRTAKGFDHISQTTIIDGGGKVYRQVYGETFAMPLLVEPLKELVLGTTAPFASLDDLVKKVRLFCTLYDPAAERYRFDYSMFIRLVIGAVIILAMAGFVGRELWRHGRRRAGARR